MKLTISFEGRATTKPCAPTRRTETPRFVLELVGPATAGVMAADPCLPLRRIL